MTEPGAHTGEAIAVVGMSCRFPGGVDSPGDYWRMLLDGRYVAGPPPEGRWDSYAGAPGGHAAALRTAAVGAFRDDVHNFDAEFFGVSPREAELMDPQQRMVLELAWEALEHAGVVPATLAGGDTGVFMGVNTDDHGRALLEDLPRIEAWTGIGASLCAVANRVSYSLDLHGPSMAVETACSASLVAVHLACQSLWTGETPLALAGGVMLMLAPGLSVVMREAGALSPAGTCKAFDSSADGYGRGEGAGVLVLKRLSDARRDGDRVHAVLRGSAVRQDGRTDGIMAPNARAQEEVLRSACARAGVDPASVDYVEAHGTGTRAGDPVEARALTAVYGVARPVGRPCLIGSVKSNIGHLEAASGVAGVLKAVLALRHGVVPASLHVTDPAPAVSGETSGLRVVCSPTPWPATDRPRRAAVSGYGYGGTIAHLVLEQAPEDEPAPPAPDDGGARVYPLSAASSAGLRAAADRLATWLSGDGAPVPLADVAHTLARRRSHLGARAAVVAADRGELVRGLTDLASSGRGVVRAGPPAHAVWVFSGHGSQWPGMGRDLLDTEPAFRAALERLAPVVRAEYGREPEQLLAGTDSAERSTPDAQVAIVLSQLALAAAWRHYGLRPSAVVGHSVGEISAAVVAGALTEPDAARLVCRRSALLRRVEGAGGMLMAGLPWAEAGERARAEGVDVVAAVASAPDSTVLSGDAAAIARLERRLRADGVAVRAVPTDIAFHSPHMDAVRERLRAAADGLAALAPAVPLYTTALRDPRSAARRDADYWAMNLRAPVRFHQAVRAALEDGHRVFVEVSPHPVVTHSIAATARAAGVADAVVTHTLRRGRDGRRELLANLGALHGHGVLLDWRTVQPDGRLAEVPTTAWQHREYRARPDVAAGNRTGGRGHDPARHSLLGGTTTVRGTVPVRYWHTVLDAVSRPYPGRHPVRGTEIVPAAVLLTTFADAAPGADGSVSLREVVLRGPVPVTDEPRDVRIVLMDGTVRVTSRVGDGDEWLTHTTARVATVVPTREVSRDRARARCPDELPPGHVVDRLADVGVAGMGFGWRVEELRRGDGELLARVRLVDDERVSDTGDERVSDTPAPALDAALSLAAVIFPERDGLRMPARIDEVAATRRMPARVWIRVRGRGPDSVDITLGAADDTTLAHLSGVRYGELDPGAGDADGARELVHAVEWRAREPWPGPAAPVPGTVVLVAPERAEGSALRAALTARGTPCVAVAGPDALGSAELDAASAVVVVPPLGDGSVGRASGIAAYEATWLLLTTVRELARVRDDSGPALWVLTRGVRESAGGTALGHASLWGTARVLATEHPELWGGLLDLPERAAERSGPVGERTDADDPGTGAGADAVLAALRAGPDPEITAVRGGRVLVPRLVAVPARPGPGLTCRAGGTYLITGGLGALGREVARWLAERGARRLVLASRTGLPARESWDEVTDPECAARIDAVRGLEESGVTVRTPKIDITDRVQAAKLLAPGELGLPPITGVVHAAGIVDNRTAADVDARSLTAVLRPKVAGALVLHELFPPGAVDFLALFSSAGPLLGLPGQAAYAAANAFLDALAEYRRARGTDDTTSLSWTSWRGLGMATSSAAVDAELAARGTTAVTAAEAFRAWDHAVRAERGHVAVLRTVPSRPGARRPPLLDELAATRADDTEPDTPWRRLRGAELAQRVGADVVSLVAGELRLDTAELDVGTPLAELGVDSVLTQAIRARLEDRFGVSLPVTLLWERPTVRALADHIVELLAPEEAQEDTVHDDATGRSR